MAWESYSDEKEGYVIYAAKLVENNGVLCFTAPVALTMPAVDVDTAMTVLDGIIDADGNITVLYNKVAYDDYLSGDPGEDHLAAGQFINDFIFDVRADDDDVIPETKLPVTVSITNTGIQPITEVAIEWSNGDTQTWNNLNILPCEVLSDITNVSLGQAITNLTYTIGVTFGNPNSKETRTGILFIAKPDISIGKIDVTESKQGVRKFAVNLYNISDVKLENSGYSVHLSFFKDLALSEPVNVTGDAVISDNTRIALIDEGGMSLTYTYVIQQEDLNDEGEVLSDGIRIFIKAEIRDGSGNLIEESDYTANQGNVNLNSLLRYGEDSVTVSADTFNGAVAELSLLNRSMREVLKSNGKIVASLLDGDGGTIEVKTVYLANDLPAEDVVPQTIQFGQNGAGVVAVFALIGSTGFDGGDGSEQDPYKIANTEQLEYLAHQVNSGNDYDGTFFKLTADIDLSGLDWTPIGTVDNHFKGSFDGDSHTINGMTINNTKLDEVGLFGYVDNGAIENLGLTNVSVNSNAAAANVGGLVGNINESIVTNCYVSGETSVINSTGESASVGGLVGGSYYSAITDSHAGAEITSAGVNTKMGGLVGYSTHDAIKGSFAMIDMEGTGGDIVLGGLVGCGYGSTIDGCFASGVISGESDGTEEGDVVAGGLLGVNNNDNNGTSGSITKCYAAVGVIGTNASTDFGITGAYPGGVCVGGLVGINGVDGIITDCYAGLFTTGTSAAGVANVGGLVGINDAGFITKCYAKGMVMGESANSDTYVGGFVGYNREGTIASSYFDTGTTMQALGVGGDDNGIVTVTDLNTTQMTDMNTLSSGGAMSALGTTNWSKRDNDGSGRYYPELRVFAENDETFIKQLFSALSVMVFNPTITFDANGGTVTPEYAQTGPDYNLLSLPTPVRNGYTFDGWYTDTSYIVKVTTETTFMTDWTIYAKWRYKNGGGAIPDPAPNPILNPPSDSTYDPTLNPASDPTPSQKPTIKINGVDLPYTKDSNGTVTIEPTEAQIKKLIENAKGSAIVLDFSAINGITGIAFKVDPKWFNGFGNSLIIKFNGYSLKILDGMLKDLVSDHSGMLVFIVKAGSVIVSVTQNGKEINWYNYEYPMTIGMPLKDGSKYTVMRDKKTNAVIPRSWYKDGIFYANVYRIGTYEAINNTSIKFTDTQGKWMDTAAQYMSARGIVSGIGNNLFAPERTVTRAEFVTMLMRALNIEPQGDWRTATQQFSDVPKEAWYYETLLKAKALGIVSGVGDNKYNPTATITRQDMFLMLCNAMVKCGLITTVADMEEPKWFEDYADSGDISNYAKKAMSTFIKEGIVAGVGGGRLDPKGTAKRSEAAQIIYNILLRDTK